MIKAKKTKRKRMAYSRPNSAGLIHDLQAYSWDDPGQTLTAADLDQAYREVTGISPVTTGYVDIGTSDANYTNATFSTTASIAYDPGVAARIPQMTAQQHEREHMMRMREEESRRQYESARRHPNIREDGPQTWSFQSFADEYFKSGVAKSKPKKVDVAQLNKEYQDFDNKKK